MRIVKALAILLLPTAVTAWEEICSPFEEIYADGTQLCEVMWNNAFKVVPDDEPSYTMWHFQADENPNDQVTRTLWGDDALPIQECHLQYFHKDVPSPESDDMRECHPWKQNACCHSDTVTSADKLRESYGPGFEWDRCGPMSQACERFFVQEACFYECEPSAGLYRKFKKEDNETEDYNEWQMFQMPIKKSYCDAWFEACRHDYFCGKGDYFECEAHYQDNLAENNGNNDDNNGLIIGLSVAGAIAAIAIIAVLFLIYREKKGSPYFVDGDKMEEHPVA